MKRLWIYIFFIFSTIGFSSCESDETNCVTGEEHCACFENGSCLHGMYCGPAGRCEYKGSDPDAGVDVEDDVVNNNTGPECASDSDCDAITDKKGFLCLNQYCVPCTEQNECVLSDHYGSYSDCSDEGRCFILQSCTETGCETGKVCDEMSGNCRGPHTCAEINCMPGQLCQESEESKDAYCLNECEQGMIWNHLDEECNEILPNCRNDWDNSILEQCNLQLRVCNEIEGGGAECGDCFDGYKSVNGNCEIVQTCSDLNCSTENRTCIDAKTHEDAYCGSCSGGFVESFGVCTQNEDANCQSGDPDSILSQCAQEHRECTESGSGASCGSCISGYVQSPYTGNCVVIKSCNDLNCQAQNRTCTNTWNAECGSCDTLFEEDIESGECKCISGYLPDETGACIPIRTCADIGAACTAAGELCIEHSGDYHAYCRKCTEDEAWYDHWETCLPCPPCRKTGETGRVYPVTTLMGHCVCETKPDYFHSESGSGGTFACDQDGDGWIIENARLAMESQPGTAEKENARCDLRYIDRFILVNEQGVSKEIMLSDYDFLYGPVPLYEPANRDKPSKLQNDEDYNSPLMSNYTTNLGGGRYLNANELNPLTKACPSNSDDPYARYSDFNANNVYDIDEEGYKDSRSNPEKRILSMFSYYLELYRGWYEKPEGTTYGRYVIAEKSRDVYSLEGMKVKFSYPGYSTYWRSCKRHRDSNYSENGPSYGFDFANFEKDPSCSLSNDSDVWCGMNHHSQFKCMQIVNSDEMDSNYPQRQTASLLATNYETNRCLVFGNSLDAVSTDANPLEPQISCSSENLNQLSSGDVVWGLAKYKDYGEDDSPDTEYVRGCINECTEQDSLPQEDQCQSGGVSEKPILCKGKNSNFGKLVCYREIDFVDVPMEGASFYIGSPDDSTCPPWDPGCTPQEEPGRNSDETLHLAQFKFMNNLQVTSTEVTQDQFSEFMGYNPSRFECNNSICPVEQVSWYDAVAFANKLSLAMGYTPCYQFSTATCTDGTYEEYQENDPDPAYCKDHGGIFRLLDEVSFKSSVKDNLDEVWQCDGYRLPTEAEWEFLARAGTHSAYYTGDSTILNCEDDAIVANAAWYCGNSDFGPSPVAMLNPNAFGLFDMSGNVLEWTSDTQYQYSNLTTQINPVYFDNSASQIINRVVRGGAWNRPAQDSRSARRTFYAPSTRVSNLGFRVVRSIFHPSDRYILVDNQVSWNDAKTGCENMGNYHLVTIDSEYENFIVNQIADNNNVWIGFSDLSTEGRWEWIDGSGFWLDGSNPAIYLDWRSGEPNNSSNNEDCCEISSSHEIRYHTWNDLNCSHSRIYICEEN